jgi:hypothetical protein
MIDDALLQDSIENDGPSAAHLWGLRSALETHAIAVADAAEALKALTVAKEIDGGNNDLISTLADRYARLQVQERATRWNVDNAVNALAEAEVNAIKRFHAQAEV